MTGPEPVAIRFSRSAAGDLQAIREYVAAQASADTAIEVVGRVLKTIEPLADFPERGSIPPELARLGETGFRQILCLPYRIIYEAVGREIRIHVIAHGRRDLASLLEQRLLRPPLR